MPTETEYRLEEFVQATIGSDGTASVTNIGPRAANERWEINRFSASGTSNSKLQVFRGNSLERNRQIDVTVRADADTSETDVKLRNGETVSFKWSSGVVGATMTCRIEGSRFVLGKRAY